VKRCLLYWFIYVYNLSDRFVIIWLSRISYIFVGVLVNLILFYSHEKICTKNKNIIF